MVLWPDVLQLASISKPDASMVLMKEETGIWGAEKAHYLLQATIFVEDLLFAMNYVCPSYKECLNFNLTD